MFSPNVLEVFDKLEKTHLTKREYEIIAVMMLRVLTSWEKTNKLKGIVNGEGYTFTTNGGIQ